MPLIAKGNIYSGIQDEPSKYEIFEELYSSGNILIEREEKDLEAGIYYPVEINWEGQRAQLRTRRPGDSIRLPGMKGNKKLQDFFVDQKIPREQRDRIPLLAIGNRVLLIIGDELSNRNTGLARSRVEEGFNLTDELVRRLLVEFNKKP